MKLKKLEIKLMFLKAILQLKRNKEIQIEKREIPKWLPDQMSKMCKICKCKFGLLNRKHHCRVCGDIFCSKCCSIFDSFQPYYKNNVRMCYECHKSLKGG